MAHWSGLLTKQELASRRTYYTNPAVKDKIKLISRQIIEAQQDPPDYMGLEQKYMEFNMVVEEDVVKFFKNEMGYDAPENKTGQPSGFTLLISISWAI